jgi:hypothetical protein
MQGTDTVKEKPGLLQVAAARLAQRRGGMPQKLGQLFSFYEMASPGLWSKLSEGEPKFSGRKAQALVAERLGGPVTAFFGAFEERGVAASLAQVHRAWRKDGTPVAVKILLPGAESSLRTDGAFSRLVLAGLGSRAAAYDMLAMEAEIARQSALECDLEREAGQLRRFGAWQFLFPWFDLPFPHDDASGKGVLTMAWMEGARLHEACAWKHGERALLGARLLSLFLQGCLVEGSMHADPNSGNLRFQRESKDGPRVGFLDFGCVLDLPAGFSGAFAGLLEDIRDSTLDGERALRTLEALGFDRRPLEIAKPRLPEALKVLFDPFSQDATYDPRQWDLRRRFREALGPHGMAFKAAAPASVLYFVRAWAGLVAQVQALEARFCWQAPLAEALLAASRARVPRPGLPSTPDYGKAQSSWLRIEVRKGELVTVDLSFPASCAGRLSDLVPLDLAQRIRDKGEDLAAYSARAAGSGYAPGELFTLHETEKSVRVWLE